ncbi:MAG: hypothetical protein AAB728_03225 [Patescibacteria group bacterium]
MFPRTVRPAAALAVFSFLVPLAAAESTVHSTVTQSVRVEQNGVVREETRTSSMEMGRWMTQCESALGEGHASCAVDGALGKFLERRMRMKTERLSKVFDRWMKRMERRAMRGAVLYR